MRFVRWPDEPIDDQNLLWEARQRQCYGVIFYGSKCFLHPNITQRADELGLRVVAVEARSPLEAKQSLLRNAKQLRSILLEDRFAIVRSDKVVRHDVNTHSNTQPEQPGG